MILTKLVDILLRVKPNVKPDSVKMESKLIADLGIDSLSMMLLAISVEDEFNIRFEGTPAFDTVQDICDYIADKTGLQIQ